MQVSATGGQGESLAKPTEGIVSTVLLVGEDAQAMRELGIRLLTEQFTVQLFSRGPITSVLELGSLG
jgi:hypothetical protein